MIMISFKDYILREGKFKDSDKINKLADYPMFSVYLDLDLGIGGANYYTKLFLVNQDIVEQCFSDARTRIQKMGFPSMHANVVFKNMNKSVGQDATRFVAGLAHGNPEADKHYKSLKSIGLNYQFLKGVVMRPEKYAPKLTETLIHEWAHVWMFNNGKAFRNAVKSYHEALLHSNIDKLPYKYFDKDPKEIFKRYNNYLLSLFSTIQKTPMDYKKVINKSLRTYINKIGNLSIIIDLSRIDYIADIIAKIFEAGLNANDYNYVRDSINNLDMSRLFGNEIKHTIQSGLVKRSDVKEKLAKLIKFTGAYGLTDPDETWAALLQYFDTLEPYHKKKIFELMQVREPRETPNKRMQKHLNEQTLLNEHVLDEVPRKVLGMSTSVKGLPMDKPYGFWIDRSGNFLPVGWCGHDEGLDIIINKARKFLEKKGIQLNLSSSYNSLFKLGWLRVVCGYEYVHYETYNTNTQPTPSQMKFMKFISELYGLKGISNR